MRPQRAARRERPGHEHLCDDAISLDQSCLGSASGPSDDLAGTVPDVQKRVAVEAGIPPVTCFTFFVELGRLLPVPPTQIMIYDDRTDAWDGWTPMRLPLLVGVDENPPPFSGDVVPGWRISFRDVVVSVRTPLGAAEAAYEDWLAPVLTPSRNELRLSVRDQIGDTIRARQSVVALTRFLPQSEHPNSELMTIGWLTDVFRSCLAHLNHLLDHLSLVVRDWALGAIEHRDLSALLPVLLQSSHADSAGSVRGSTFVIPIHDDHRLAEPRQGDQDPADIAAAAYLVSEANRGDQPFESVFRYLRAAHAERIAGDPTRAVVDLATAMEILFSQLIATGGSALGWDDARIERANKVSTGLRGRVQDHLGPLLGAKIDVFDGNTHWGQWWARGYMRRNDAVHHGQRLHDSECAEAWQAATQLINHVVAILKIQRELEPVAERLGAIAFGEPAWRNLPLPVNVDWF